MLCSGLLQPPRPALGVIFLWISMPRQSNWWQICKMFPFEQFLPDWWTLNSFFTLKSIKHFFLWKSILWWQDFMMMSLLPCFSVHAECFHMCYIFVSWLFTLMQLAVVQLIRFNLHPSLIPVQYIIIIMWHTTVTTAFSLQELELQREMLWDCPCLTTLWSACKISPIKQQDIMRRVTWATMKCKLAYALQ